MQFNKINAPVNTVSVGVSPPLCVYMCVCCTFYSITYIEQQLLCAFWLLMQNTNKLINYDILLKIKVFTMSSTFSRLSNRSMYFDCSQIMNDTSA